MLASFGRMARTTSSRVTLTGDSVKGDNTMLIYADDAVDADAGELYDSTPRDFTIDKQGPRNVQRWWYGCQNP